MIGDRVKLQREAVGLTRQQLASLVGVSRAAVSQWESGDTRNIRPDNLLAVARTLRVRIEWLINGRGPMEAQPSRAAAPAAWPAVDNPAVKRDPGRVDFDHPMVRRYVEAAPNTRQAVDALLAAQDGVDQERLTVAVQIVCEVKTARRRRWSASTMADYIVSIYNKLERQDSDAVQKGFLELVKAA